MAALTRVGLGARIAVAGVALAAMAAGCATTQQVKVSEPSAQSACAFLGNTVCAELTPTDAPGRFSGAAVGGGGAPVAGLRYINPNAQWTQYNKVLIAPITFWAGDATKVSPGDQLQLTDYFYQTIERQLSTKFQVVQQPGPGVMTIQVALIDAQTATPILRTISMVIPQARALATLKYLATGTYAFVGGATAEAKILDSVTHQVLAAAVDKRVGGGSLKTAAQWQWGDAENAMTAWAQQLTTRLSSWTSGTPPS
jgi:Protein of unknown function (DUF3313)